MADISKITTLDGTTYDVKDAYSRDNLFLWSHTPSNMSLDSNGLIWLSKGSISSTTGASSASSSGKYYRSQSGESGANGFMYLGNDPLVAICGLDWVEWNSWCYSGTSNSSATHTNTDSHYILGIYPILLPASTDTDKRFTLGFRTLGADDASRPAFTDQQITELKQSIRFYKGPIVDYTSYINKQLPWPSNTNGTYVLKCNVLNGAKNFFWDNA